MSRNQAWVLPPLLALLACSAASSGPASSGNNSSTSSGGATSDEADAGAVADANAAAPGPDAAASSATGPAGKAGADAFATQICAHEEQCALIDASAGTCTADFEAYYETSGANPWSGANTPPPLELYRADYVSALGACIAAAGCSESLQTSETDCSAALLTPNDAGMATIEPTTALTAFCSAFAASTCLAANSGSQDCLTTIALLNDRALQTATSCLSGTECSTVTTCFTAAFTQE